MRKKIITALLGIFSVCSLVYAEEQDFTGTVVTASGKPIMGATVTVTGTNVNTITDMDGRFSLVVPDGYSTVTITYSGMKKQVVSVQRTPIILYAKTEGVGQKAIQPVPKKSTYKRNAFNLEISVGGASGDLKTDCVLELDLGYKYRFSKYMGLYVLDVSAAWYSDAYNEDKYYWTDFITEDVVCTATTGLVLWSPRIGKLSLFGSFNAGAGYDLDGDVGLALKARVGVNFGKCFYIAYKYSEFKRENVVVDWWKYNYDELDMSVRSHMVTLGLNF